MKEASGNNVPEISRGKRISFFLSAVDITTIFIFFESEAAGKLFLSLFSRNREELEEKTLVNFRSRYGGATSMIPNCIISRNVKKSLETMSEH